MNITVILKPISKLMTAIKKTNKKKQHVIYSYIYSVVANILFYSSSKKFEYVGKYDTKKEGI